MSVVQAIVSFDDNMLAGQARDMVNSTYMKRKHIPEYDRSICVCSTSAH